MKYYIFDLDGTIADSMGYWYGSFREDERYDHERMQQVRLAMKEKYAEIIQPRPGALELLERLYSEGAVMCIASATDRWVSEPFMKKLGLGASIAECTVVEDSAYCAETAHNAGFRVIGIYDPNTAPRGDVSQFADVFIRELAEFPD